MRRAQGGQSSRLTRHRKPSSVPVLVDVEQEAASGLERRGHEVEPIECGSVVTEAVLASSDETRDVTFTPEAQGSGDRAERGQPFVPAEPGHELA